MATTTAAQTTLHVKSTGRPPRPKVSKTDRQKDHYGLVLEAAQKATQILESYGLHCVLFGSVASRLYGASRSPQDVDLLVCESPAFEKTLHKARTSSSKSPAVLSYIRKHICSPPPTQDPQQPHPTRAPLTAQDLKEIILFTNSRNFYLRMPRDPDATYRILYYRRDPYSSDHRRDCKVDVLLPGTMYLPSLDRSRNEMTFFKQHGLWAVPFGVLLLHKLQGWDDHRKALEPHKIKKQAQDAADVKRLLALPKHVLPLRPGTASDGKGGKEKPNGSGETAKTSGKGKNKQDKRQANNNHPEPGPSNLATTPAADPVVEQPVWWSNERLFCEEFRTLTTSRVDDFCLSFPGRAEEFRLMGFNVPSGEELAQAKARVAAEAEKAKQEQLEREKKRKDQPADATTSTIDAAVPGPSTDVNPPSNLPAGLVAGGSVERTEQDDEPDANSDRDRGAQDPVPVAYVGFARVISLEG